VHLGQGEDRRVPRQKYSPTRAETCQRARVTGRAASSEGDHVCAARERVITQQPPDCGGINVVGASDISLRLATGQPLQCFPPLMRRHLARTTEAHAARLGALATLARAGADKLALELGEPTEHRQHQPAVRSRGVAPCVLERLEAGTPLGNGSQDVEQVPRRSRQPVEARDDERVVAGHPGLDDTRLS